jgi:hypothetical protein
MQIQEEMPTNPLNRVRNSVVRGSMALFRRARHAIAADIIAAVEQTSAVAISENYAAIVRQSSNPLSKCGWKVFSQTDEDGITYEIIRRIDVECGVFAEFGVGNGLENNTVFLASLGWKGFWVGGEALAFGLPPYPGDGKVRDFAFFREFVKRDNVLSIAQRALGLISETEVDVASLDLDGNDYYFVEELLSGGFLPKVFIVEYNAKFIPPVYWKIRYDPDHRWRGDDYLGASLMEFDDLFKKYGYFLVCCNPASGSNAFFVRSSFREAFRDIPADINSIWSPPRYLPWRNGHRVSPKTVESIMRDIGLTRARRLG